MSKGESVVPAHRLLMLTSLVALFIVGVNTAAQTSSLPERQAVEQAMRDYAATLRAGTPEAVTMAYTADGELLLPGLPALHGRDAIKRFLAPLASATEVESVEMHTDVLELQAKTAIQWGTYRQVAGAKGQPKQTYEGRYAAVWHLEGDGRWRLFRLMMQPVGSGQ
jgi:uncharacterized protein (TIGR02246 family)